LSSADVVCRAAMRSDAGSGIPFSSRRPARDSAMPALQTQAWLAFGLVVEVTIRLAIVA
jgi:hypothetical protein